MKTAVFIVLLIGVVFTTEIHGQPSELVSLAKAFLDGLTPEQKNATLFPYENPERLNWNFVPMERKGISLGDLAESQRAAGMRLLLASLSQQGYNKATGILDLEAILREVEGRPADDRYRDPKKYFFSFFGVPEEEKIWGWRLEGHHISLNFSSANGGLVASTPTFMGANPAVVPRGNEKGRQTLKLETDLGFELVNSLSQQQLKVARFSEVALPEIVSGNSRQAILLEPKGIPYSELNESQKRLFDRLLDVYVGNYQLGFSETLMKKIMKAGMENLSFAWSGSLKPGSGHYYRIQGPVLLIEYDNTQTNANHVHTTVRDLTNDFAADILREHYRKDHK